MGSTSACRGNCGCILGREDGGGFVSGSSTGDGARYACGTSGIGGGRIGGSELAEDGEDCGNTASVVGFPGAGGAGAPGYANCVSGGVSMTGGGGGFHSGSVALTASFDGVWFQLAGATE